MKNLESEEAEHAKPLPLRPKGQSGYSTQYNSFSLNNGNTVSSSQR